MTTVARRTSTKAQAALALRMSGAKYEEIVEVVGYPDVPTARRDVNTYLAQDVPEAERKHYRRLANQRLESLLDAVWDKAHNATHAEQLPAVRAAKEIIKEMIALHGAAAPQELLIHNPTTDELFRFMREKGIIAMPTVVEVDPFEDVEDAEVVED